MVEKASLPSPRATDRMPSSPAAQSFDRIKAGGFTRRIESSGDGDDRYKGTREKRSLR
jgi:hypothetical protein